jgi:Flp pilus assembly protein TadG
MAVSGHKRRRAADDRGTALIESVFVFPILIIIVFGIVEMGFLFRSASMVTGASRSGARVASAGYGPAYGNAVQQRAVADSAAASVAAELLSKGITDTPELLWIYRADANGNTPAGNMTSCTTDCFRYSWNGATNSWVYAGGSWAFSDACGAVLDSVGVFVQVQHTALVAPSSLSVNTVEQKTVMRLEPREGCITSEGPA